MGTRYTRGGWRWLFRWNLIPNGVVVLQNAFILSSDGRRLLFKLLLYSSLSYHHFVFSGSSRHFPGRLTSHCFRLACHLSHCDCSICAIAAVKWKRATLFHFLAKSFHSLSVVLSLWIILNASLLHCTVFDHIWYKEVRTVHCYQHNINSLQ